MIDSPTTWFWWVAFT